MQYTIKKKLLGQDRVLYKCVLCACDLESPLSDAGQEDTCPYCGGRFTVPGDQELKVRDEQKNRRQEEAHREAQMRAQERERKRLEAAQSKAVERISKNADRQITTQEGMLSFEGAYTPQIALLDNERVVDVFEAGFWDLGFFGWLFGYKQRLVLTTHRMLRFEKRIINNKLDMLWLPKIRSVTVGHVVNWTIIVLAILFSLFIMHWDVSLLFESPLHFFLVFSFLTLIIIYARKKVLIVSTGIDKIGIHLIRIHAEESSRFVNKVFAMLQRADHRSAGQLPEYED